MESAEVRSLLPYLPYVSASKLSASTADLGVGGGKRLRQATLQSSSTGKEEAQREREREEERDGIKGLLGDRQAILLGAAFCSLAYQSSLSSDDPHDLSYSFITPQLPSQSTVAYTRLP